MSDKPALTLKADLNADGVYEADWSPYFLGLRNCGLKRRAAVDQFSPRSATVVLNNNDSRFSPRNAAGPYFGQLTKAKRVQLKAVVTTPAVTNLCTNPSFETDVAGWTKGGTNGLATSTEQARFGRRSAKATYQDSLNLANYDIALTAAQHTVSVYLWIPTNWDGGTIRLNAFGFTSATGTLTVNSDMSVRDRWQRVTMTFTPDAGDLLGAVRFDATSAPTAGRAFYIDGLLPQTGGAAGVYCDGDQAACSWTGTAHASTSSRPADPSFSVFTGELRKIETTREGMTGRAEIELTGVTERMLRTHISAGPFSRKPANDILQRVLDVIEGVVSNTILGLTGEAMRDGAFRFGGDAWATAIGTPTSFTLQKDTGAAGNDPIVYGALEGDNVMEIGVDGIGDGREHTIQSQITPGKAYHVSCFVRAGNAGASGKQVKLTSLGTLTAAVTATAVLSTTDWTYLFLTITFDASETTARVRITADETFTGLIWVDCAHVSPVFAGSGTPKTLAKKADLGSKWTTEVEYFDVYRAPAGGALQELVASVGGWFYEAGDGDLQVEDYSRRDSAVVSVPKLRLSDVPEDGQTYTLKGYDEPPENFANAVKVGSLGYVWPLPSPGTVASRDAWALQGNLPIAFAANEKRTFFAAYALEGVAGASGLIARRAVVAKLPASGWTTDDGIQTPYIINYGRGGDVIVKKDGSGGSLYQLIARARLQHRQTSEGSSVQVGTGEPLMELEMLGQATRTAAMTAYATWAQAKYSKSPAVVEVLVEGLDVASQLEVFGRDIGTPVWLRHVSGQGALYIDDLFYTEGVSLEYDNKGLPRLTLTLEEAPEAA
jgi:hypothetical protein